MTKVNPFTWSRQKLTYLYQRQAVPRALQKAGAEAAVQEFRFRIMDVTLRRQQGAIDTATWYAEMKQHTKGLQIANTALARGGFNQMRPVDYERVSQRVYEQWNGVEGKYKGLRSFAEDIERGRYGTKEMTSGVLQRAGLYPESGRAAYENELVVMAKESGRTMARRILAASDHCEDCVEWAALGWIDIDEMESEYPIAASVCGSRCHCVIITGTEGDLID